MKIIILVFLILFTLNAKELEKVSVQLQWLDQFQFAGYYMAKEKGFYEEAGLDVEIKKYRLGLKTIDEVISKRATYGIGRPALIINRSHGKKIVLISALFQSSPLVLLARADSNISSVKDFIGKTVMATFDDTSVASIEAMLKHHNIEKEDLNFIPYSYDINDLISRKTDLMTAYITNQAYRLKELGVEYTVFNPVDYGFNIYADLLFTSEGEVQKYPQRARNFRDATLRGWEYAFEHIDEAIRLIKQKYNIQNKSLEALKYEADESKKLAYFNTKTLGTIEPNKIQRIYDLYNIMGLVHNELDLEKFILKNRDDSHLLLSSDEKEYLKNKKEIRMCVVPDSLPYSKIENSKYIGMSADYMQFISQKIGVPFTLVPTSSWSESLHNVKMHKCDILPAAQETPERKKYLNFSKTFFSVSLVIATRNDKIFISDIKTILDKKLGIAKGYSHAELLKSKYPNINIVEVQNSKDGLEKVADNQLYGYISDLASVAYEIQRHHANHLKVSGSVGNDIDVGMGVRSDDITLLNILNKAIASISEKQKQSIYNHWLSVTYENGMDYTLVVKLTILFVIIILTVLFFLMRENRLKEEIELLALNLEKRVQEEVEKNIKKDKQMFYQSRLAQMGEMISMIAHQWRQPLGAIAATSIDLKMKMELQEYDLEDAKGRELCQTYLNDGLNDIESLTQNLTTTIDDFRNFYKPNKEIKEVGISEPIAKALNIVRSSLRTNNILLKESYNTNKKLQLLESEVMQVVLNILKNAQDNFQLNVVENATIWIETHDTDDGIILTVCDNGGGIDEDIIKKIFDPYFSTKHEKNGTGLGLYMSKMIIEDHHRGKLTVENHDRGVCFSIVLKGKIDE